jgi:hypothetical protein
LNQRARQASLAVERDIDSHPRVAQAGGNRCGQLLVVLDHKHPHSQLLCGQGSAAVFQRCFAGDAKQNRFLSRRAKQGRNSRSRRTDPDEDAHPGSRPEGDRMAPSIHTKRLTPSRTHLLTAAALLSGVLVAGCGGGSTSPAGGASPSASAASAVESGVALSMCIRSHGVPNFPDPKVSGHTIRMGSPRTMESPAFQSALRSCQRLLPKGAPGPEASSSQAQARMLEVSACMRKHGISGFPDPTTSPPSNPGNSAIVDSGGYFLAIPKSIDTNSPAFKQAAAACNFGPGR